MTFEDPRADAVRERHLGHFGDDGVPVPVGAIAVELLGLHRREHGGIDCSEMLVPAERRIVGNANEHAAGRKDPPLRRFRFAIAHEIGHWVCHCDEGRAYCRPVHVTGTADRTLEGHSNVSVAELLMPAAVRDAWDEVTDVGDCAARFDVSLTAMQWRLYRFGLVQARPDC
jgi:hypothetical protein